MRTTLLVAAALAAFTAPISAAEINRYTVGSTLKYDRLVADPDLTITYAAFDPINKVAVLAVRGKCGERDTLRLDLKQGDQRTIAIKKECASGSCKVFLLSLMVDEIRANSAIYLEESLEIAPSYSN